ncbi:GyrI-like domain-containing protein [Dorea sp. YH-dor228]|uniref:GyrI-like domain-containing protein n=2 Tax=Lachnospirales TaxID=3085636 RepID=UPI003242619B
MRMQKEHICEEKEVNSHLDQMAVLQRITALKQAACIYHKGSYNEFPHTYAVILQYIEENGYEICGNIREKYIDGVWNKDTENDWLSEIQIPVKKTGEE